MILRTARFAAGIEWPGNYPANIVYKPDRQTLNFQRFTTGVFFSDFHSCNCIQTIIQKQRLMGHYPHDRRVAYRRLDTYIIFRLSNNVDLKMIDYIVFLPIQSGFVCL